MKFIVEVTTWDRDGMESWNTAYGPFESQAEAEFWGVAQYDPVLDNGWSVRTLQPVTP